MKKESNRNRTRRTAVALALLLSFAAPQALRGNLGIYAPTCGGCGECPACTADKDSGADGPSGFSRLIDLVRGYVASVLEPPRIFNNTRPNVPLAASATVGSLRLTCAFGNAREALGGPGRFTVRSITPSPLLWTPAMLRHSDPLLSRIARVELPREASAGLRAGDASRCPVVTGDFYSSQYARRVVVLDADGEQVAFAFRNGQSEGLPAGAQSTRLLRMVMRDASGGATSSAPAWYDLLYPNGDVLRHDASTGDAAWLRTKDGRVHTAASRGLEAVRDAGGRLRQVRSDADGLADIVPDADGTGYEIRLYPPAQCGAKDAQTGLFTVSGAPASALRVWCPDTRLGARIDIRKTVGGAETDHWRFEYSRQREGWLEVRQDGGTASSQSTVWSRSRMVKWVTLAERAADGSTASRTEQTVRRFPFGERTVRLVRDPGGADLATAWTYGEHEASQGGYGRVHTVARPDGGWEELGYDGHGRLARRATPWKDADPGDLEEFSPDPEDVREERFSYSAVDPRDTVSANDARPRTEEVRARGVVVSRVYHAYYVENGRPVEVLERCRRPDAAYGAADSLRTVAVSYPAGDASSSASAGRLHTVLHPGGLLDTYEYEYGSYAPSADGPGVFTPGAGAFLRTTATRGTAASPAGVAGRTLRSVAVSDAAGCVLLEETRLYTGVAYELLSWTVRAYDASHRQVSELKSDGEVTETAWNCCSKASETSADGRTATYAYDALHRLTHMVLWSGGAPAHTTEYAYDAAGHVLSRTVSGGGLSLSAASAYDLAGRLVSSTDEAGLSTTRAYSRAAGSGNVETVTRPGGATTVTSYYRDGRVKSVTGTAQVAEHYDYGVNADGSQWTLVRVGAPASPRWTRTTTDMLGNVVMTERPGYGANAVILTQNFYDAAGRLVKTAQTGSADVLYEYDALGELFRTGRDADGNGVLDLSSNDRITETAYGYLQDNDDVWWLRTEQKIYATVNDATSTIISITEERLSGYANGIVSETRETDIHDNTSVTTVSVDRTNATVVTETLSPESSVAERRVEIDGLVVSLRSKSDVTTTFGYDGLRRRVSVTDPRTGTSTVTYNAAGQVSAETDAAGNTTSYGYDNAGRLAWRRNALGKYSRYAYNLRDQQIRVWGDAEYPVEYDYDQYGQRTEMTTFRTGGSWNGVAWPDPAPPGDTTTWNYDTATGLLTSKVYADGYGPSYTYTVDGKLASRTWARKDAQDNDLVTNYTYNLFGEMTGIDYSDSTPDITYSYNRVGKLSQVTDAVGTRTFAYNSAFDEVSETITGLYSKTLTRTYTGTGFKGKKQGLSIDNASHYTYGYDSYGRMDRITIPSGSFNYTRLANSDLVSQMTRPNGITTTWSYETDRDLITQVQNGTVSTYGYVNDAIGRRTSMSRSGSAYANPDTISYTYNDRSELTGASSNVDTTYSYSYAYDPIGNRVTASEAGVPWTFTANSLNQYTSATENNTQLSFSYDLDGSMTYRPVDATSGWTQVWNGENRMVETYRGNDRLTFKYDYLGRRVEKCVYSGNTLTSKTCFVYDGFKCVEELDGLNGNSVLMRHTWQPFDVGLDVILTTADTNSTSHFLHDSNKNVMQKTDVNGIIREKYAYAPFGESIDVVSANVGFSSEASDFQTGLVYFIYRYYTMRLGKWASRDILGEIVLNNLYAFCHNNPIEQYDHIGLFDDGTQPPPVWEFDIGTPIYDFFKITIPIGYKKVPAVPDNHLGHSDFDGNDMFDYTKADHYFWTSPFNPFGIWNHFRNQTDLEKKVRDAIDQCNVKDFEYNMHYYQDAYVHYDNGYRAWPLHGWNPNHWFPGHASANLLLPIFNGMFGLGENPDNTTPNNKGYGQWMAANKKTKEFVGKWKANCCRVCKQYDSDGWMPKSSGNCL